MGSTPDNLRAASFRGVPFEVEAGPLAVTVGRRGTRVEFPLRDLGSTEDLGRRMRDLPLRAFVSGEDMEARRDNLLAAIEAAGPGTLVHPLWGAIRVAVDPTQACQMTEQGGVATFTIPFIEHGDLEFITSATVQTEAATTAAATLRDESVNRFAEVYSVADKTGRVIRNAIDDLSAKANAVEDAARAACSPTTVRQLSASLSNLTSSARAMVKAPVDLAAGWVEALGLLGGSIQAFAGAMGDASIASASAAAVVGLTQDEADRRDNVAAQDRLVYLLALSYASDETIATEWTSYDDAMAAASLLSDEYLRAMVAAATVTERNALADARASLVDAVALEVVNLPRLVTYTPAGPMSALELAQELYGDGRRCAEIVARNKIAHPGFLSVGVALQVASW